MCNRGDIAGSVTGFVNSRRCNDVREILRIELTKERRKEEGTKRERMPGGDRTCNLRNARSYTSLDQYRTRHSGCGCLELDYREKKRKEKKEREKGKEEYSVSRETVREACQTGEIKRERLWHSFL